MLPFNSSVTSFRGDSNTCRSFTPTLILANEYNSLHPFGYGEVLAHSIPGAILEKVTPKAVDAHQHARDIQRAIERFLERHCELRRQTSIVFRLRTQPNARGEGL
jgi:hypothetical protein